MGSALERRIRIQSIEGADLRVRLPRRQLRAIGNSRRHARRRDRRREGESDRSQQDCRSACRAERREKTVKLEGTKVGSDRYGAPGPHYQLSALVGGNRSVPCTSIVERKS